MKTAFLKLQCFDGDTTPQGEAPASADHIDALRARAFEEGYGAGWTDALDQMRNEDALRRMAAEEALQAASFSFHEARSALEANFVDLVAQIIEKVLPSITRDALPLLLERELRSLANRQFKERLEVICAPAVTVQLTELLASVTGHDMTLSPEESFSEAQVLIRINQNTRMIDLEAVIAALKVSLIDPVAAKEEHVG